MLAGSAEEDEAWGVDQSAGPRDTTPTVNDQPLFNNDDEGGRTQMPCFANYGIPDGF